MKEVVASTSSINLFAWKTINNGLPTRVNTKYRHLEHQDTCELCGQKAEDVFHASIRCPHACCWSATCYEKVLGPAIRRGAKLRRTLVAAHVGESAFFRGNGKFIHAAVASMER